MIVPVRGEYLELDESQHHLVNSLIYPVRSLVSFPTDLLRLASNLANLAVTRGHAPHAGP
eukprot:332204-Rhodomonas_salina.3